MRLLSSARIYLEPEEKRWLSEHTPQEDVRREIGRLDWNRDPLDEPRLRERATGGAGVTRPHSPKVAGAGCFGAALMMEPELVADCAAGIAQGGQVGFFHVAAPTCTNVFV